MGSSGDSEKVIQRLNDELREARELANKDKYKLMELQGKMEHLRVGYVLVMTFCNAYTSPHMTEINLFIF